MNGLVIMALVSILLLLVGAGILLLMDDNKIPVFVFLLVCLVIGVCALDSAVSEREEYTEEHQGKEGTKLVETEITVVVDRWGMEILRDTTIVSKEIK